MLLMYFKRKEGKQILDEIDRDYESYNYMPNEYKELISMGLHNNLIYRYLTCYLKKNTNLLQIIKFNLENPLQTQTAKQIS